MKSFLKEMEEKFMNLEEKLDASIMKMMILIMMAIQINQIVI
jgi:hypothetical protein